MMNRAPYIYVHADDYGMTRESCRRIQDCWENGCLNRVSIMPNGCLKNGTQYKNEDHPPYSIHLNLVEGKSLTPANQVSLLVGQNGYMKNSFFGLLILSISPQKKQLEEQLYLEIKAQMMAAMKFMRKDQAVGVDSHQHTHMIPLVFRVLLRVIEECRIPVQYLRIPAEPIMPFLMEPSMYLSYKPVNLIKNVVLNFLWLFNRKLFQESGITSALFCGIIFSGNMDAKRVMKVFPHFYRLAEKRGYDLEFLFHPGYIKSGEEFMDPFKTAFHKFYLSSGRKLEYAALHNPKWCEMITKNNDHSGRED